MNAPNSDTVPRLRDDGGIELGDLAAFGITIMFPLLPVSFDWISLHGEYELFSFGKYIGRVQYRGMSKPDPDQPDSIPIGADTYFTPATPAECINFTIEYDETEAQQHEPY